jgi:hypothetical protein
MKSNKRSPLKSKPLRYAGKSIDQQIDKLINDKANLYIVYIVFFAVLAGLEWWRFYFRIQPSPWIITFMAILIILFSLYKVRKIFINVSQLKLGRDGERIIGETLDSLREKEYKILHDIVGENFNIDHVIISTKGIFLIETKTFSKPNGVDAKILFNGKEITVNGMKTDKNILNQVLASSNWLRNLLKESTGKEFRIKPVIVFPGWFVETTGDGNKGTCWALNENSLPQWIENERISITKEDVSLAAYHLSRYIKSKEE